MNIGWTLLAGLSGSGRRLQGRSGIDAEALKSLPSTSTWRHGRAVHHHTNLFSMVQSPRTNADVWLSRCRTRVRRWHSSPVQLDIDCNALLTSLHMAIQMSCFVICYTLSPRHYALR